MELLTFILTASLSGIAVHSADSLPSVDLGRASGGRIFLNGRMLSDTTYRFRLEGTVSGADTTWDLRINGLSTTTQPAPAQSSLAQSQNELRARVRIPVERMRLSRKAERRPMTAIETLDAFAAEFRRHTDLVRSARRVSETAFEVCWQGDDDCDRYGVTGSSRLVPANAIRQMLVDDARLLQLCATQHRVVTISTGGFGIPRLESMRDYVNQSSGEGGR